MGSKCEKFQREIISLLEFELLKVFIFLKTLFLVNNKTLSKNIYESLNYGTNIKKSETSLEIEDNNIVFSSLPPPILKGRGSLKKNGKKKWVREWD